MSVTLLAMDTFLEWTGRVVFCVAGMVVVSVAMMAWCLLVFLMTGRLPWMVRKYF